MYQGTCTVHTLASGDATRVPCACVPWCVPGLAWSGALQSVGGGLVLRLVRKVGVYLVFVPAPPVVSLNQYCKLNRYSAPPGVFLSVQCVSTGPTVHVLVCARVPCVCPGSAPRCADWPLFPKCGRPTKWPTFAYDRHPQPKIAPQSDLTLSTAQWVGTTSRGPTGGRVPSWGNLITN